MARGGGERDVVSERVSEGGRDKGEVDKGQIREGQGEGGRNISRRESGKGGVKERTLVSECHVHTCMSSGGDGPLQYFSYLP